MCVYLLDEFLQLFVVGARRRDHLRVLIDVGVLCGDALLQRLGDLVAIGERLARLWRGVVWHKNYYATCCRGLANSHEAAH